MRLREAAWLAGALAAVLAAACSDHGTEPLSDAQALMTGATLTIHSGDGQTARGSTTLRTPLRVRLLDAGGSPIAGARMRWVPATGSVAREISRTNADGIARAAWTLGEGGAQALTVSLAADASTSVTFTARALAGR